MSLQQTEKRPTTLPQRQTDIKLSSPGSPLKIQDSAMPLNVEHRTQTERGRKAATNVYITVIP